MLRNKHHLLPALLLLSLATAALAAPVAPAAPEKTAVAVLQFEPRNISQSDAVILSDRLRAELVGTGYFNVLEREQMDKILREQKLQLTGACNDASCLVKVGQLMAVTKMMGGTISKIGNTYTVQARVIDVEKGVIEKEVSQDFTGTIEDLQQWGMRKVVWKIVPSASLFVTSIPSDAEVYWDNRKVGRTDLKIEDEAMGSHRLTIKKPGYQDYEGDVTLKEVRDYDLKVRLSVRSYLVRVVGAPAGAKVWLGDTILVGALPCSTALTFGSYNFKARAKGYRENGGLLTIDRDQDYKVRIDLKRRSRVKTALYSLLLPGRGQYYSNRPLWGTFYLLTWAGALAYTGVSVGGYVDARKGYDDARDDYLAAANAVDAARFYDEWQEKYGDAGKREKQLNRAITITAAWWAVNFLDAIVMFPGKPKVAVAPEADKTGSLRTSVSLTYNW